MLSRAATMDVCTAAQCHCALCDQLFVAQAFAAILAQQLKLLARVHRSIAALRATAPSATLLCIICCSSQFSRLSSSRLAPEFPRVVSTTRSPLFLALVCYTTIAPTRGNYSKKGHQRSLFEPRRAERTCALQTSDHRSAANNAPLEELLRSRREQLRQNPKFAIGQKEDARHR